MFIKKHFFKTLQKLAWFSWQQEIQTDIIVFVIVHDNKLRDGGYFRLNLILKKKLV